MPVPHPTNSSTSTSSTPTTTSASASAQQASERGNQSVASAAQGEVTAEEQSARDRLYEERMEEEYAKREGGA
ncbi:hypothetical protein J1614_001379 [Plenodomus biglobosus]|nr:hypothetical protein J1614_001379 [Plenodomus biglobosus]